MSLVLHADLALMLGRETQRPASVLERAAHKLALKLKREASHGVAFVLKHETTQTRVLMLKRDFKVCVSKNSRIITFGRDCEVRI